MEGIEGGAVAFEAGGDTSNKPLNCQNGQTLTVASQTVYSRHRTVTFS